MSLRTVAGETFRPCRSTRAFEPTGSSVATKSSTMARSTASLRSSCMSASSSCPSLALVPRECQWY